MIANLSIAYSTQKDTFYHLALHIDGIKILYNQPELGDDIGFPRQLGAHSPVKNKNKYFLRQEE